jgi:hypothetical protein
LALGGITGSSQRLRHSFVGVERSVGDQRIGLHGGQEVVGTDQVVRLAVGQEEVERIADRIDQRMDLGAQPAA